MSKQKGPMDAVIPRRMNDENHVVILEGPDGIRSYRYGIDTIAEALECQFCGILAAMSDDILEGTEERAELKKRLHHAHDFCLHHLNG